MSNNFTQEERRPNLHSVLISTLKNVWKKYEKSDLDQQLSVLATELRKKLYVIWKRRVYVRVRGRERLNVLKHNEARQRFCAELYKIILTNSQHYTDLKADLFCRLRFSR